MLSDNNPSASAVPVIEAFHYPPVAGSADNHPPVPDANRAAINERETAEQRISQAREEGIREGAQRERARLEQEMAEKNARITEALAAFERERAGYYSKIEAEVVHLALAIASKILHREAQVDRMLLAALAKVALDKLQQKTQVRVRVAHQQAEAWRQYFAQDTQLTVAPEIVEDDSLPGGDCILETELGSTELGLEPQLKEIEAGLFDLLAQRPETPPQRSTPGGVGGPGVR